jgi:hypothetical protein
MTDIDDSNDTPPTFWFGELNGRLRDRMRDELHDLDLGRRGWRILHTLADHPATADDLAASLPRHGRRGRPRPEADHRTDPGTGSASESGGREWRGRPDWMRREWERRQEMYRAWMEHDRRRPQPDPHGEQEHTEHNEHEHHEHEHEHEHYEHEHEHRHEHHRGSNDPGRDRHHDHHHAGGHESQQAFERGFERGFVRGFDRGLPGGAGRFGHGAFGGGFGAGRFGHDPHGQAHGYGYGYGPGHGHATFPGRPGRRGCRDHLRAGIDRILADFVERGWVWFDGDTATLTDEGRTAHDAAFERIRALRRSVTEGIDPADLATTMATLEAMARNLGWTPAAEGADGTDTPDGTEGTDSTDTSDGGSRSDDPATD